ncbi:MAG: sulfatase [Myxococcota bacterium]
MRSPLALFGLWLTAGCSWRPDDRPDIVLVVIDTLRADHLGVYGHPRPTSPNLDQMAREGVWFSQAYAQSGWTLASFASLFTGQLPHQHRVGRDPLDATKYGSVPAEVTTLAESLQASGYATAAIMNNTFLAPAFELRQGFDNYDWQGASNDRHRSAALSVRAGMDWLNQQDKPSFLVVHMMEPHLDYAPPPETRGTFLPNPPLPVPLANPMAYVRAGQLELNPQTISAITALYDEEVLAADSAVGELRRRLAQRERPTVTIVTSDHGEEFWDHGGYEHGHSLYSELTRIPLIVTGPDLPVTGEIRTPVQHLDLYQGILSLAGAKAGDNTGGEDLFSVMASSTVDRPIVNENTLYGPPLVSLVHGGHRLVFKQLNGAAEVWKLGPDGMDRQRLTGDPQKTVARQMLPTLEKIRGDLRPISSVAGPHIPDPDTFQKLKALGYVDE